MRKKVRTGTVRPAPARATAGAPVDDALGGCAFDWSILPESPRKASRRCRLLY